MAATLYIVGTPLDEAAPLSVEAAQAIREADLVIGENRKNSYRYLKAAGIEKNSEVLFFLDPYRKDEWELMSAEIGRLGKVGGSVALFSDCGMPLLFDPGLEVLELCRQKGFKIRTRPSATSWATACALSGFPTPYHIVGFLERDGANRLKSLKTSAALDAACVFMDTPYRYELLLKQLVEAMGPNRRAFLAWEIAKSSEIFIWGTLGEIVRESKKKKLERGEFILITGAPHSR